MILHASSQDMSLRANGDTDRGEGGTFPFLYYLTDPEGNRLTDPEGNYLVGYEIDLVYPQKLHAHASDYSLRAE